MPPVTALGTPQQIAAEKTALKAMDHPDIKAAQEKVREEVLTYSFARMKAARESLDNALMKWTLAVLMRELAADPVNPAILWYIEDTPYDWHGYTFPAGSGMGDNPDQIYRITFLDGAGRYEIKGKLAENKPVHYLFEVNRAAPGLKMEKLLKQSKVDMGNQVSIINNLDMKVEADGHFRIVLGGDPEGEPNYLRLAPGINEISIREVLSDWDQRPALMEIRRLMLTDQKPLDEAEIVRRTAQDLSSFVHFWFGGNEQWMGDTPSNSVRGPHSRDGGWGFLGAVRYKLGAGEALAATLDPCGAKYMGLHITDPWMSVPDGRKHVTSLSISQAVADADGSITYVIGPEDPGVANWIDTAGFAEGTSIFRWVDTPPGATVEKLVRRFDLIKIADIRRSDLGGGAVTPQERRAQVARRAVDVAKRRG